MQNKLILKNVVIFSVLGYFGYKFWNLCKNKLIKVWNLFIEKRLRDNLVEKISLNKEERLMMEVKIDDYKCITCDNARSIISVSCHHCLWCSDCFLKKVEVQ